LVLILGAISLFILAYQWGNQYQRRSAAPPVIGGLLISPPASLPDFELREALGRPFAHDDLSQGWTLLAFGDLSRASGQLAVQRLIDVYNRVADERALRKQLRLVFVTLGDDSSLHRDFAGLLPALKILGGDPEQIQRLRADIGLGATDTAAIFVVAPGGYLVAFLPETEGGAPMAEDLKAIHASSDLLLPETP
jgi:cytochrome oxidase Cu insertion factor (SCO1/SenC/PrrC family)